MKKKTMTGLIAFISLTSFGLAACGSSGQTTAAAGSSETAETTEETSGGEETAAESSGTEGAAEIDSGSGSTAAAESGSADAAGETAGAADQSGENGTANDGGVTVITAATGGTPKPYTYYDDNNVLTGYDIEVVTEIFEQLPQYELRFAVVDFSSIFTGMTSGLYQIGVNSFTYNEERAQSFLYSYPYDLNSYVIVQKEGDEPISSFAGLAGLTTESNAGGAICTGLEKWNEDHPEQTININYSDIDTTTSLQHVLEGAIDFLIIDPAMYEVYVSDFGLEGLQASDLDDESKAFISDNLNAYLLFPQNQAGLRDEVDVVIKQLHDDGTLAELTKKWFKRELVPDDSLYDSTIN